MTIRRPADFLALSGALAAVALMLGACTTVNVDDAFSPASLSAARTPAPVAAAEPVFSEPGQYPNLNVVPQPAAAQITDGEKQSMTDELRARRTSIAAQGAGAPGSNAAALRQIGNSHAQEAIRVIEGN